MELKNDKVKKAFGITDADVRKLKDYCLRYGTFMNPSGNYNFQYKEVLSIFKRTESFTQMLFFCKSYYKTSHEKKQGTN
jgi:hypothetical protein